ncbi:hypothetical protein MTR67_048290 [Solanum verrucosum]|uniref:DUF4283 domain-containing protein n=1 Tax=Solanum verrucosum TaxID=315347 RepID=A0AAF0ZZF4_SOLVR|nr:hypothetical protein MTR67_048290 [Solanum verrucosum]
MSVMGMPFGQSPTAFDKQGLRMDMKLIPRNSVHSWSRIVGRGEATEVLDFSRSKGGLKVKITMDDNKDEVEYWKIAVICYVPGSNPPQLVTEGYFNRFWKGLGIDKIAHVNKGVFLVIIHCPESRSKVVESGVQMFDKKSTVVKPWRSEIDLNKEVIEKVPIWIRLVGLDIKY